MIKKPRGVLAIRFKNLKPNFYCKGIDYSKNQIKNDTNLKKEINALKKNSFNHFILPIGYKGKIIEKYLKKNKNLSIKTPEIIKGIAKPNE